MWKKAKRVPKLVKKKFYIYIKNIILVHYVLAGIYGALLCN